MTALNPLLFLLVAVTLGYLIWRVARYSRFEETDAGRAFMLMKCCLMALVLYALGGLLDPDGTWRGPVRVLVIGGIWVALVYQVRVVVRNQGGFRRNRPRHEPKDEADLRG